MKKIAFVTCHESKLTKYFPTKEDPNLIPTEPPFTPDDQLVVDALRETGLVVEAIEWGTEVEELKEFKLIIMRSPWDYIDSNENRQKFIDWIKLLEANKLPLENDASFMLWLLNKTYLRDFQSAGIEIVESIFIKQGSIVDFDSLLDQHSELIFKPCVSASAQGLFYLKGKQKLPELKNEIQTAVNNNDYIVQAFLPEILTHGEWSLTYIDGKYCHAVNKTPAADNILVQEEYGGTTTAMEASQELIEFGDQVLAKLPAAYRNYGKDNFRTPLYLRLDIIPTKSGPQISECEGVEPDLFFKTNAQSVISFVEAINGRI